LTIAVVLLPGYVWVRIVRPRPLPPEAFVTNDNYHELVRLAGELYEASNGDGSGTIEPRITAALDLIRVGQMQWRASGNNLGWFANGQSEAELVLWELKGQLSAEQCRNILRSLEQIDRDRESWEIYLSRSRRIREGSSWYARSELVLADLAGIPESHYARNRDFALFTRMLIAELAIHAFQLENDRLPTSLEELVPVYVAEVPKDPFTDAPLKYSIRENTHVLYSVGPDGIDDGGRRKLPREPAGDYPREVILRPQPPQRTYNANASKADPSATTTENK
jgi:hypothetical protein